MNQGLNPVTDHNFEHCRPQIQYEGKPKVAFLCVHNSCRSQMAEALAPSEFYVVTKAASLAAPGLLPWIYLALLLLLACVCVIVLAGKNAPAIAGEGVLSKKTAVWTAVLFAWSVLGMTGVSTYLYFNF